MKIETTINNNEFYLDQIEIKTHINNVTIDRWNKLKDFYAELENAIISAIDSIDKVMKESEQ